MEYISIPAYFLRHKKQW